MTEFVKRPLTAEEKADTRDMGLARGNGVASNAVAGAISEEIKAADELKAEAEKIAAEASEAEKEAERDRQEASIMNSDDTVAPTNM